MQQTAAPARQRLSGFIRKIKSSKGFGFVKTDGGLDVFIHIKQVKPKEKFQVGAIVEFTLVPAEAAGKLPRAVEVKVLS